VGAQLRRWQPRDPFDPEIFNRQTRALSAHSASLQDDSAEAAEP
jgi:hypothetical protein